MKKVTFSLLAMMLFISCGKEEDSDIKEDKYYINIESYYKDGSNQDLKADANADVFIYYGILTIDIIGFDVDNEGILTKEGKKISPDQISKIGQNGKCTIIPHKPNEKVTIIIKSNFYINRISHYSYPNSLLNIVIKNIASV